VSLTALTAGTLYDVFIQNQGGGSLALTLVAWSSSTAGSSTRATALSRTSDGMLVLSGSLTQRYVGTILITAAGGLSTDSINQRYVWNYLNRSARLLSNVFTGNWTYNINCWRPIDQDYITNYKHVEVVVGWQDGSMAELTAFEQLAIGNNSYAYLQIALDAPVNTGACSWNNYLAGQMVGQVGMGNGSTNQSASYTLQSVLMHHPTVGYHYYTIMENVTGTVTAQGNSGLIGKLSC
jgi:hypothetical protein